MFFLRLVVISVIVMFLVSGWFVSLCVCVDMSGSWLVIMFWKVACELSVIFETVKYGTERRSERGVVVPVGIESSR